MKGRNLNAGINTRPGLTANPFCCCPSQLPSPQHKNILVRMYLEGCTSLYLRLDSCDASMVRDKAKKGKDVTYICIWKLWRIYQKNNWNAWLDCFWLNFSYIEASERLSQSRYSQLDFQLQAAPVFIFILIFDFDKCTTIADFVEITNHLKSFSFSIFEKVARPASHQYPISDVRIFFLKRVWNIFIAIVENIFVHVNANVYRL